METPIKNKAQSPTKTKAQSQSKPQTPKHFKVKWFKLILEIVIIIAIPVTIYLINTLPELLSRPVYNMKDDYKTNYRLALNYDYSKGPDEKLKQRFIDSYNNVKFTAERRSYDKFALAIYYENTGEFSAAITELKDLFNLTAYEPQIKEIWRHLLNCYKALDYMDGITEAEQAFEYYNLYYPDDL